MQNEQHTQRFIEPTMEELIPDPFDFKIPFPTVPAEADPLSDTPQLLGVTRNALPRCPESGKLLRTLPTLSSVASLADFKVLLAVKRGAPRVLSGMKTAIAQYLYFLCSEKYTSVDDVHKRGGLLRSFRAGGVTTFYEYVQAKGLKPNSICTKLKLISQACQLVMQQYQAEARPPVGVTASCINATAKIAQRLASAERQTFQKGKAKNKTRADLERRGLWPTREELKNVEQKCHVEIQQFHRR